MVKLTQIIRQQHYRMIVLQVESVLSLFLKFNMTFFSGVLIIFIQKALVQKSERRSNYPVGFGHHLWTGSSKPSLPTFASNVKRI